MNATVKALRKKLNELQKKEASLYEQYDSVRLEKAKCLRDFTEASNLESKENLQKKIGKCYKLEQHWYGLDICRCVFITNVDIGDIDDEYSQSHIVAEYKEILRSIGGTLHSFSYRKDAVIYDTKDKNEYDVDLMNFDSLIEISKEDFDNFFHEINGELC